MINFSKFNSIYELTSYFNSEDKCRKTIFESRWDKNDVICPFCGQHHCVSRTDGRFHCSHCKANFSVTVGTIFENTKIPLVKWFLAMYLISCHKKGISSVQLATDISVTQKTAWYILHKVRTLFKQDDDVVLSGVVECDEMYLGGRETNKHETKKTKGTQGGAKTKTPVFGMTMKWKTEEVDKETGEVKEKTHTYEVAKKVADTKASTIIPIIRHFVADGGTVVTDESSIYNGLSDTTTMCSSATARRSSLSVRSPPTGLKAFGDTSSVLSSAHTTSCPRHTLKGTLTKQCYVSIRRK